MTHTPLSANSEDVADDALPVNEETQVHRYRWLQRTSRSDLYEVLEAGLIAHVGFLRDGKPMVIPMAYALVDGHMLMHGSTGAGLNRTAKQGVELCATISICDGLVYAQNLFDSTLNYRCAIVFGTAIPVEGEAKTTAIKAISERLMPGRWNEVEPPTTRQMAATYVLKLALDQVSVKIRAGAPDDSPVDSIWTGYVPMVTQLLDPVAQEGVNAAEAPSLRPAISRFNDIAIRHLA
ncbi:hypothetical protein BTO20_00330 [Mycobacterium dioxanotrophicus]|uniref:Flavin-nucleotide-binding protein n=1 Tax=Mycobacterium dioxanotrophicus TaxID=482462 RepID=A0A1Y0BWJ6_9MYCO|nr:pyridoxamine 5'-phosphate oxidase family protein [Mycobacterium dioxanotrophicus]ART67273.1 hypothetical protein BTO20_00330 [Mycobacterium dioxanotrophicus]